MKLFWVVVRVFCLFLLLSQCNCQRGPVPPSAGRKYDGPPLDSQPLKGGPPQRP